MLMSLLLPGLEIDTLWTAIVAVAVLGLLNALLWPLLTYLLLPFAVFTPTVAHYSVHNDKTDTAGAETANQPQGEEANIPDD